MVKKNTGKEPFEAPKSVLDANQRQKNSAAMGRPISARCRSTSSPISTSQAENSGSATLTAGVSWSGWRFDGNYESMVVGLALLATITRPSTSICATSSGCSTRVAATIW